MKKQIITTLIIILCLSLMPLSAQTEMKTKVDWSNGLVYLDLTTPLPVSAIPLPTLKYRMQREMESQFPIYLRSALAPLIVDSRRDFSQALREEPGLLQAIAKAGEGLPPVQTHLTADLRSLVLSYQFTLFPDIIRPLLPDTSVDPLPILLGYEPSASFTGIVIYAAEPLPVHGETNESGEQLKALAEPCLLPKIYDENMNLILSAENQDPLYRETWGTFQYTPSMNSVDHRSRVGDYPYYTMALGLFGIYNTDLILSNEAVRKLLSREDTRKLLKEGRITVITAP